MDRVIRTEERRARLLGLDRPARAELGIRAMAPREELTPEQIAKELEAFGMPAAIAVAAGPSAISPPVGA